MLISYLVKFSIELLNFQESPGISKLLLPAVTFSRWLNQGFFYLYNLKF